MLMVCVSNMRTACALAPSERESVCVSDMGEATTTTTNDDNNCNNNDGTNKLSQS